MSSKRKLLIENTQLIHIVSEIVVLFGVTFYFSSKNKKIMSHIEELAQRLEDQEDHIQKLENSIKQMTNVFTQVTQKLQVHDNNFNELLQRINILHSKDIVQKQERKNRPEIKKQPKESEEFQQPVKTKPKTKESEQHIETQQPVKTKPKPKESEEQPRPIEESQKHVKPILKEEKQPVRVSKIQFKKVDDVQEEEEEHDDDDVQSDSDLDSEISQELAELEMEEEDDSSLKKQV
jgi:hypothetical protein